MPVPRPRLNNRDLFDDISDIWAEIRKLKRLQTTSWINTGIVTVVVPHSLVTQVAKLKVGVVHLRVTITLGAAITVNAQGGIIDTPIATLQAPFVPQGALTNQSGLVSATAPHVDAVITTSGQVMLVGCVPGGTLANGQTVTVGGVYLL